MAENREFIAAKDLPVTEEKEVNVLVVNPATGELAQKSGANLGGGGGGSDFCVIYSYIDYTYRYIGGDYEAIKEKLITDQPIMMDLFTIEQRNDHTGVRQIHRLFYEYEVTFSNPEWNEPENAIKFYMGSYGTAWFLFPDNTITVQVFD